MCVLCVVEICHVQNKYVFENFLFFGIQRQNSYEVLTFFIPQPGVLTMVSKSPIFFSWLREACSVDKTPQVPEIEWICKIQSL